MGARSRGRSEGNHVVTKGGGKCRRRYCLTGVRKEVKLLVQIIYPCRLEAMGAETVETVRLPAYAEGTVIKLGEGKVAIYINSPFRAPLEALVRKRVRVLIIEKIDEEARRRRRP